MKDGSVCVRVERNVRGRRANVEEGGPPVARKPIA